MRHWLSGTRVLDNEGNVAAGARLYAYIEGSSTPLDTYSDADLGTVNTNPVVADGNGLFGNIYVLPRGYKYVLKNADDSVTFWTQDNSRPPEVYTGSVAPVDPAAGQMWFDTSAGPTAVLMKYYDGADWIALGTINHTTNAFTISFGAGSAAAPTIAFSGDPDTGFYSYAANQIGVALGGALKYIFGLGLTIIDGLIVMGNAAGNLIRPNTVDGSDNQRILIAGGGDSDRSRGAVIQVSGNEAAGSGGLLTLTAGNVAGSAVKLITGDNDSGLSVQDDGAGNPTVTFVGGTPIYRFLRAKLTNWNPASITSTNAATQTVSVPGAKVGDLAIVCKNGGSSSIPPSAYVSSADTVTVTLWNPSAGSIDPSNDNYEVLVIGFVP